MPLAKIFEHIIGTNVSATSAEMPMAAAMVMPNSPNSRPTLPGMNEIGRNTAIKTSVVAMTAKPISRLPSTAASNGASPCSSATHDVLEHDDRIVDHRADSEHRAEQRQHVDREARASP